MRGMFFWRMNGVMALITLALGYIVCLLAKKEKGLLKTTGYIIGVGIVAISAVIVLGKVLMTAKMCIKTCPMEESTMSMPEMPVMPKK